MKRVLCLSLLMLFLMTGCMPVLSEKIGMQQAGKILHREQTAAASGYGMEEIYEAAEEFVWERGFLSNHQDGSGNVHFLECYTDMVYLFSLKKGEAQLVMEIGHNRWRLYMEKTFLQQWQVTDCRLDSTNHYQIGKT